MARIFSIQFQHQGFLHNAMVSMRTTPFFVEYTVSMLDEGIAGQLPNNKIISTSKSSFVFSDSTEANSPQLMQGIIHAIACHVQIDA
jgi:hypothetical protein